MNKYEDELNIEH